MITEHHQLLDDYLNGRDVDMAALEQLLLSSREFRDEFRRLSQIDTVLHLQHACETLAMPSFPISAESHAEFPSSPRSHAWIWKPALLGTMLALLLSIAVAVSVPTAPVVKVVSTDHKPAVATVLFQRESKLAGSGRPLLEDTRVPAGPMSLSEGSITLIFDGGCELTINGPAELNLLTANSAVIYRGELLFENNPHCDAFELSTPHSKLLDIGTMYSLVINEQSEDLRVHEGEVWRSSLTSSTESCLVVAGKGYRTGEGVVSLEKVLSHDQLMGSGDQPQAVRKNPYLAFESFDYPAGRVKKMLTQEDGAGFRGPWSWYSRDLEEKELTESVVTFQGKEVIFSDNTVIQRRLARPINTYIDNTMYFAFDFEFKDLTDPDILFFRMFSTAEPEVRGSQLYELLLLGHQNRIVSRFGGTQTQDAFQFQTKTTYRVVGKILSRKDGPDQIFVSVMPASETMSASPPVVWSTASRPMEFRAQLDFLVFHTYSKSQQSLKCVVVSDDWSTLRQTYLALRELNKS